MADTNDKQPTVQEFIDALFPPDLLAEDEHPVLCRAVPDPDSDGNLLFPATKYNPRSTRGQTHTCIATFGDEVNDSGRIARRKSNFKAVWLLQLDDVGTKSEVPPIEPSVIIETKPGNYTYLYLLSEPCEDPLRYEQVAESLKQAGYGDPNCTDAVRLFRLPGSKPVGKEHAAKVILWRPDKLFDLDTLLDEFDVAEVELTAPEDPNPVPAPGGMVVVDEVFDWLQANDHVIAEDTAGFWKVHCPWVHLHSDHRDMAKYKPATEDNLRRVFWCWHTHGQDDGDWGEAHGIEAFLAWVESQGGPSATPVKQVRSLQALAAAMGRTQEAADEVAGAVGPMTREDTAEAVLEELVERLVWFAPQGKIIDLWADNDYALMTVLGAEGKWAGHRLPSLTPTGQPTTQNVVRAWMNRRDKMVTDHIPHMDPRLPNGFSDGIVNTYRPFQPLAQTRRDPEPFVRLVRHVAPQDWEYVLDWMAYKLQRPWERMVALVSYTPQFGTGRNALFHVMRLLLGERNCAHMTASRLFGEKQDKFNAHLLNLMVTIGEVDEGDASGDRRVSDRVFNRLKEMVDPNERSAMIERKGIDGERCEVFTSFMIATNAGGGIPLEDHDRRFSVLAGNDVPLIDAHPDLVKPGGWLARVRDAHDLGDLSAVYHMLMERDVSQFLPNVPHNTEAKVAMMEDRKNDIDIAIESLLEGYTVFTAKRVFEVLRSDPELMMDYDRSAIKRQVEGWARKHSGPLAWITGKQKKIMLRDHGGIHFPRALNGHQGASEMMHRNELIRFLEEVKPRNVGSVSPMKRK